MRTAETYFRCCGVLGRLLDAIERCDMGQVAQHVDTLHDCLAARRPRRGDSTLRLEQLEAIEGLAEFISRCLGAIDADSAAEIERIRATAPLLRHVAGLPPVAAPRRSSLPGPAHLKQVC